MKLQEILKSFPELRVLQGDTNAEISYVQQDSRKCKNNDLFILSSFCPPKDKEAFLKNAQANGAKFCIITNEDISLVPKDLGVILALTRPELYQGKIASLLLGEPSKKLKVIGVTGTNGKTSITQILFQLANLLGLPSGLIGTIHIKIRSEIREAVNTTPDASELQLLLAEMVEKKLEWVFMEASSHGLKLGRTEGISFDGCIFTNLTQDHLDFHKTFEDYRLSKFHLFELLEDSPKKNRFAVLSKNAEGFSEMFDLIQKAVFHFSRTCLGNLNEIFYSDVRLSILQTQFKISIKGKSETVTSPLLGDYNVENLCLAITMILQFGFSLEKILELVPKLEPVPGRFQVIPSPDQEKIAVVDYAHTPDALDSILKTIQNLKPKMLICVVGCGGDRDKTKRPIMASIAEKYSDLLILTSDNPRTEDPEAILDDMESGIPKNSKPHLRIADRRQAIQTGVEKLAPGGVLLVAGKGHEDYQIIGKEKFSFSDVKEIQNSFSMQRKA